MTNPTTGNTYGEDITTGGGILPDTKTGGGDDEESLECMTSTMPTTMLFTFGLLLTGLMVRRKNI
jgi:hypothetical protein